MVEEEKVDLEVQTETLEENKEQNAILSLPSHERQDQATKFFENDFLSLKHSPPSSLSDNSDKEEPAKKSNIVLSESNYGSSESSQSESPETSKSENGPVILESGITEESKDNI